MSTSPAQRLASAVTERRRELGLNQMEVSFDGGPSNTTLTDIENGRTVDLTTRTAKKLDTGLRWEPGSALALWRHGDTPRPIAVREPAVSVEDRLASIERRLAVLEAAERDERRRGA